MLADNCIGPISLNKLGTLEYTESTPRSDGTNGSNYFIQTQIVMLSHGGLRGLEYFEVMVSMAGGEVSMFRGLLEDRVVECNKVYG